MNGLDASEEAKPDERSKDEDSTDSGRGLGSARHAFRNVHSEVENWIANAKLIAVENLTHSVQLLWSNTP